MKDRVAALVAAGLLTACGAGDADRATGPAQAASVCDGASASATCIEVRDAGRVESLRAAFLAGERGGDECPGLDQQVYRVVFDVDGGQRTVDVPATCGPTLTSPSYDVTDAERALVESILGGR